jgi:hypothetical protein
VSDSASRPQCSASCATRARIWAERTRWAAARSASGSGVWLGMVPSVQSPLGGASDPGMGPPACHTGRRERADERAVGAGGAGVGGAGGAAKEGKSPPLGKRLARGSSTTGTRVAPKRGRTRSAELCIRQTGQSRCRTRPRVLRARSAPDGTCRGRAHMTGLRGASPEPHLGQRKATCGRTISGSIYRSAAHYCRCCSAAARSMYALSESRLGTP